MTSKIVATVHTCIWPNFREISLIIRVDIENIKTLFISRNEKVLVNVHKYISFQNNAP